MCRVKQKGGRQGGHDYSKEVILTSIMFDSISKNLHSKLPDLSGGDGT